MCAKVIDHQQAIQSMMAERYLLKELTENDLEAFEAHLFDCAVCFEQVKAGTEFVGYLKRIGTDDAGSAAFQPGWSQRMARKLGHVSTLVFAGLFLCAAGFNVFQGVALHQLTAPQIVTPATLHGESRANSQPIPVSSNGYFELRAVFTPSSDLKSYKAVIENAAGKEMASIPIYELNHGEVQLRLHAGPFRSGNYNLFIRAEQAQGGAKTVGQYPFELKLQD
jgi:hypothetical protein